MTLKLFYFNMGIQFEGIPTAQIVAILCFIFILLTILVLSFELVVSASARVGEM